MLPEALIDRPTKDWIEYNEFNAIDGVNIDTFETNLSRQRQVVKTLKSIIRNEKQYQQQRIIFRFYYL
jgi:hypothetical protein